MHPHIAVAVLHSIVDILHRDDQLFVVNKPPGVLAQPNGSGDPDVLTWGRKHLSGGESSDPFLGLVHRLDRPSSGVMVLASTSDAARKLSAQFRERSVEKRYVVLVEGTLRGIGSWTDYIQKSDRHPRIVPADHSDGKRAELEWMALDTTAGHTLLQVELKTGRPHQIRLQASKRGHPVVGDRRYGADSVLDDRGIALHHALLRIEHPVDERRVTFTASPPPFWTSLMGATMHTAVRDLLGRAGPPDPTKS